MATSQNNKYTQSCKETYTTVWYYYTHILYIYIYNALFRDTFKAKYSELTENSSHRKPHHTVLHLLPFIIRIESSPSCEMQTILKSVVHLKIHNTTIYIYMFNVFHSWTLCTTRISCLCFCWNLYYKLYFCVWVWWT